MEDGGVQKLELHSGVSVVKCPIVRSCRVGGNTPVEGGEGAHLGELPENGRGVLQHLQGVRVQIQAARTRLVDLGVHANCGEVAVRPAEGWGRVTLRARATCRLCTTLSHLTAE